MAYAALVSLAQTIDQILNRPQLYSISPRQKQHVITIYKYAILLQAFLEFFSEKADDSLEGRIGYAANLAEDIIENLMLEKVWAESRWFDWTFRLSGVIFDHQLKKVTEKLDSIGEEVMYVKNRAQSKDARTRDFSIAASSSGQLAPTAKNVVVDFNEDLLAIKERLCGEPSKLHVIPIVGLGGIGKTTLARNCYDDRLIVEHFQIRVWITFSQDYSKEGILSQIVHSMKEFMQEGSREGTKSMVDTVYQTLKGRKYLIVMDDVWSMTAWDDVKRMLPDDGNGSRIMLTTRLSDVAAYADSSSPLHEMRLMDELQSWNLLRQKVFEHQTCPLELEDIGQEIARKCKGLPLAVVVIAGVLSGVSKIRASWVEIAKNVSSAVVAQYDGLVDRILSLSYRHLPHHLRPCFLYMGGFPEDHEIHVSKLIKLWVAEGFLKHPDGFKTYEEMAEEYLEDLVKRSLVLVTRRKSNGRIKICGIHDIVRAMCIRKSLEKKFLLHVYRYVLPESIKNQRRLSIFHYSLNRMENIYGSSIRTIICFQNAASSLGSLGNFRLLRVLDVLKAHSGSDPRGRVYPPDEIFDLFHLRFLALYYYTDIPQAISKLQNLQTFILCAQTSRTRLPISIWWMPQLRHLVSSNFDNFWDPYEAQFYADYLPSLLPLRDQISYGTSFVLANLQTLSSVRNLRCTLGILSLIPNLKKLGMRYVPSENEEVYELHNLVYLRQLEKLKLKSQTIFVYNPKRHLRRLFHGKLNPVFPRMLRKLTLSSWQLPWENITVVGSLPNLEVLKLRRHEGQGSTWETTEGQFPCLKYLLIDSPDLEHWITKSTHFPRLKCLILHGCPKLSP